MKLLFLNCPLALLLFSLSVGCASPATRSLGQPGDSAFVEAVGESPVVFVGEVVARPGRTTDAIPADVPSAIVRIDTLIRTERQLTLAAGDLITVVDSAPASEVGKRYVFLTYGWAADSGLVVGRRWREPTSTPGAATAFVPRYQAALLAFADSVTRRHLPESDVVIAGTVSALEPWGPAGSTGLTRSETSAAWRVARLDQPRVLRGDSSLATGVVRVVFPGTRHPIYAHIPRPDSGDSRLYLLHRLGRYPGWNFAGIDTSRAYLLIHRSDVRPIGDTSIVIQLLQ
ncbi:MAG: hypothetical protein ACKVZ0_17375 [Gemmatimonadales bacterium]